MEVDLLSLIKSCKLFSSLDDQSLTKLITQFEKVDLNINATLFQQGDLLDCLYILISGKLILILKTGNHQEKVINEIYPGDTLGELPALSHEPCSGAVKAVENSVLLRLSTDNFLALCHEHPAVMYEAFNLLVRRSRQFLNLIVAETPPLKHIALIAANNKVSTNKFYEKLTAEARNKKSVIFISEHDPVFSDQNTTLAEAYDYIDDLERKYETIIYLIQTHLTLFTQICFEKINKIFVIADETSKHYIDSFVTEKLRVNKLLHNTPPELILLHETENKLPKLTSKWLKLSNFGLHHHIRINQKKDIQRILRFIRGVAVGLVLGGGGLRSWSHLGAIKALEDAGIPIDIIGGTSAGAIVAGFYAQREKFEGPPKELQELAEITRHTVSFTNLSWPAISLFSGNSYTQKQKEIYGNARIENLWLPCFCVTCNLSDNSQVIPRSGYLWKIIRASSSVPAIFPPVVSKNELHLDGGILNNLPVDIMKRIVGSRGTVIASELTHYSKDTTQYNFPPILPFSQTLLAKSHLAHGEYKFPSFVETFLKALLAGSSAYQDSNSRLADLLISPDLSHYSLLDVSKKQESELIELGYNAGAKAIRKWRRKNGKRFD